MNTLKQGETKKFSHALPMFVLICERFVCMDSNACFQKVNLQVPFHTEKQYRIYFDFPATHFATKS